MLINIVSKLQLRVGLGNYTDDRRVERPRLGTRYHMTRICRAVIYAARANLLRRRWLHPALNEIGRGTCQEDHENSEQQTQAQYYINQTPSNQLTLRPSCPSLPLHPHHCATNTPLYLILPSANFPNAVSIPSTVIGNRCTTGLIPCNAANSNMSLCTPLAATRLP